MKVAYLLMANERGSVAVLGLIALMLLGVMGAGMMALSIVDIAIAENHRDGVAAQYLAEAGAQWAIAKLKTDKDFTSQTETQINVTTYSIDENPNTLGSYTVTTERDPKMLNENQRLITSIGSINKAKRQITVQVVWLTNNRDSFEAIWNN
jgi:Tfp pilus assembly protein PilX